MTRHRSAPLLRCAAVWLAATAGATPLIGWLVADLGVPGTGEEAVVTGCSVAAALAVGWLWALVGVVALDAARGRTGGRAGVPGVVRRLVLAACGLGVAGGLALPAYAAAAPEAPLTGLPLPDRATSARGWGHLGARPAATPTSHEPTVVVVTPGDSLWTLAEAELPRDASDAEVDARWREVHAANRAAVGDDPDLIHPGLRLRLPPVPPSAT